MQPHRGTDVSRGSSSGHGPARGSLPDYVILTRGPPTGVTARDAQKEVADLGGSASQRDAQKEVADLGGSASQRAQRQKERHDGRTEEWQNLATRGTSDTLRAALQTYDIHPCANITPSVIRYAEAQAAAEEHDCFAAALRLLPEGTVDCGPLVRFYETPFDHEKGWSTVGYIVASHDSGRWFRIRLLDKAVDKWTPGISMSPYKPKAGDKYFNEATAYLLSQCDDGSDAYGMRLNPMTQTLVDEWGLFCDPLDEEVVGIGPLDSAGNRNYRRVAGKDCPIARRTDYAMDDQRLAWHAQEEARALAQGAQEEDERMLRAAADALYDFQQAHERHPTR